MKTHLAALWPTHRFRALSRATGSDCVAAETDNKSLIRNRRASLEKAAAAERLNGFFANSVNSPSMNLVNFSCCVCSAPNVTREVTAQPTRSAVRTEAGVHAGV
jgi:hypothetical protein